MPTSSSAPPASYDLIVVGLGAMGAATAYHAAKMGLRVLGIDRYSPPHNLGSTSAETRITRLAVGEGPQYLPFVARSHQIWRDLEQRSGQELLYQCGGHIVTSADSSEADRWGDFVSVTDAIARQAGLTFEVIGATDLRSAHPEILLAGTERVGFEPTAGIVMAERAIEIQITQATSLGAEIRTNEQVVAIEPDATGVSVTTGEAGYRASHVVNATGPWFADLADPLDAAVVEVTRQVALWFDAEDPADFSIDRFPFLMWIAESLEEYVAFFPTAPGATPGVKVLSEQFVDATDPASVDRVVSQAEIDSFYDRLVAPRVTGISRNCIQTQVCLYTNTPDDHFLIDHDPRSDRITVMSPCSGHGFKHSTALGEAVAEQIAAGTSTLDLTPFGRSRFDTSSI